MPLAGIGLVSLNRYHDLVNAPKPGACQGPPNGCPFQNSGPGSSEADSPSEYGVPIRECAASRPEAGNHELLRRTEFCQEQSLEIELIGEIAPLV